MAPVPTKANHSTAPCAKDSSKCKTSTCKRNPSSRENATKKENSSKINSPWISPPNSTSWTWQTCKKTWARTSNHAIAPKTMSTKRNPWTWWIPPSLKKECRIWNHKLRGLRWTIRNNRFPPKASSLPVSGQWSRSRARSLRRPMWMYKIITKSPRRKPKKEREEKK